MTAELLYEAIGEISESYIAEADALLFRSRQKGIRHLIAACLTLLLLAVPVSAEMRTGYISNLLMPLYGGAQTELVDSVGIPINATATVNGYTLSADAVIGDRYNIGITYTLRRDDGAALPEDLHFDFIQQTLLRGGGGGWYSQKLSDDRTVMTVTQSLSSNFCGHKLLIEGTKFLFIIRFNELLETSDKKEMFNFILKPLSPFLHSCTF